MSRVNEWLERSMSAGGKLMLEEQELGPEFFDLSSRIAGECMQKFVNYGQQLAIVISDPNSYSPSFRDLAREHQDHSAVRFFTSSAEAQEWLAIE